MPRSALTTLPQPIFNEGSITADPTGFKIKHPSDAKLFDQIQSLLTKDVVSFSPSRLPNDQLFSLQDAFGAHGAEMVKSIQSAGKIIFHSTGDTGASNEGKFGNELRVADQLTADCQTSDQANRPAFLYQLGDVVYDFGESRYYYDQFYDPYRNYPAPIFAIPGNHDSFVVPNTPAGSLPLEIFQRNFCATEPTITPEAGSLHRTAMTQPGVYFTLDAPFVRIIGLFSNALEDPGVISSEKGKWKAVPDLQLDFLTAQLNLIKKQKYNGAVILALHHPPFSYSPAPKAQGTGGNHGGSPNLLREIDTICKAQGVYPHAVLSGHAHNYQRFSRMVQVGSKTFEVPFIICGDGGHNVNRLVQGTKGQDAVEADFGADVSYMDQKPAITSKGLILKHYDDQNYGYLRITVDAQSLKIGFNQVGTSSIPQSRTDLVTVDLASHTVVGN
ncbi:MAG TPA: metallophosphoesterase [Candidatus Acidoferrales bacterium]